MRAFGIGFFGIGLLSLVLAAGASQTRAACRGGVCGVRDVTHDARSARAWHERCVRRRGSTRRADTARHGSAGGRFARRAAWRGAGSCGGHFAATEPLPPTE